MADVRGSYNVIHLTNNHETIGVSFSDLVKAVDTGATVDLLDIVYVDGAVSSYTRSLLVYFGFSEGVYTAVFYDGHNATNFTATDKNTPMIYEEP